jgi:hypothetical protein
MDYAWARANGVPGDRGNVEARTLGFLPAIRSRTIEARLEVRVITKGGGQEAAAAIPVFVIQQCMTVR